ncbi:MAG: hypothetical protein QOG50_3390 [Actinomycetota bacterium]|nr:hypothetical protein [Actinomycetota bacterium]
MPQFGVGGESETVLLGCLIKEHLRLWRSDARGECVRPLHPSALRAFLARGLAPRASLEPARYREFGRLEAAGVLVVGNRPFAVETCAEPEVSDALWTAAAAVFQEAAADALERGEYIVVEPGGWEPTGEIYAVAGARRTPGGEWFLYVEASPAPRAPSWPEPPEGQPGWGVTTPADPEALAALGDLLADAVSMWAASPLDVVFTFGKQSAGPWPPEETPAAIESLFSDMRADIEQLHATRQLSKARDLSARCGARFNHTTYPVFFTGDLRSRLVLVHHNPQQRENDATEYQGGFEFEDFDDYLTHHRRFGYYRWELGREHPSPVDHKEMRFLRHWGVIDFLDAETSDEKRTNAARAIDRKLQLELIPYGSPKFPPDGIPPDVLAPYYERLMRVITAYPRNYVILCGTIFELLFAPYIVERDDHSFRLPTSTGVSRVEYRFSNLALAFDGRMVAVGLAPNFASPGVPMDAYGQTCHGHYREISH